ncbi:MAG: Oxygen-independent coproporphyrinogen-III oxidase 1 [Deltaproteobacteria bacterium ADurb.Bin510]|nr:MAG: Oxygen-independent coproporphyrinogen-III oxidase 1 [Deltaproteobacteria bacterium ADurb.Bin510]
MPQHVYVHIPYCLKKCSYCAFSSVACAAPPEERYVRAVLSEAGRAECDELPIETLYLGGGTPSLFSPAAIQRLLAGLERQWGFASGIEVTLEVNPETLDRAKAAGFRAAGLDRASLGVQSLNDQTLKTLGRVHSAARSLAAVEQLRAAGFTNLSLDLIYAIPGQSLAALEADLDQLIALKPEHVSAYLFTHEEGTIFETAAGADEDLVAQSFYLVRERLQQAGYAAYEISNFARPGFESRHNLAYWAGDAYVGLGAAAVGRVQPERRYRNLSAPEAYMQAVEEGRSPVAEVDELDQAARDLERRFLSLRTSQGLALSEFPTGLPAELYRVADGRAILTPAGLLVSDEIFSLL